VLESLDRSQNCAPEIRPSPLCRCGTDVIGRGYLLPEGGGSARGIDTVTSETRGACGVGASASRESRKLNRPSRFRWWLEPFVKRAFVNQRERFEGALRTASQSSRTRHRSTRRPSQQEVVRGGDHVVKPRAIVDTPRTTQRGFWGRSFSRTPAATFFEYPITKVELSSG
jgi:hypothetical protein